MINKYRLTIDSCVKDNFNTMKFKIEKNKLLLNKNISKLDALSPLKTLGRGYSVVENDLGKVVKSKNDVRKGQMLNIILNDGKVNAIVD